MMGKPGQLFFVTLFFVLLSVQMLRAAALAASYVVPYHVPHAAQWALMATGALGVVYLVIVVIFGWFIVVKIRE